MILLEIIACAVLIVFGAAGSIWGTARLSERFAWGRYWIAGLLIAIIGALPELMISLMANAKGLGIVAVGTPIGSSVINVLLLGGLAATICPTRANESFPTRAVWGVAAAIVLLMGVAYAGRILSPLDTFTVTRRGGALLIVSYLATTFLAYRHNDIPADQKQLTSQPQVKILWPSLALLVGIALVAGGAALASAASMEYIKSSGASQEAIGLIGLAFLAALPEITTVIYLAKRQQTATLFSDLMHSTTANLLLILGITALVDPIPASVMLPANLGFVLFGAVLVLAAVSHGKGRRVSRGEGIVLMAFYLVFALFVMLRQDPSANLFF